jgi:hypothetical protein
MSTALLSVVADMPKWSNEGFVTSHKKTKEFAGFAPYLGLMIRSQ